MRLFPSLVAFFSASLVFLAVSASACTPRTPAQAEAAYTAEQLRCVDVSTTLAESKACRRAVDEKWGVKPRSSAPNRSPSVALATRPQWLR